MKLPRRIALVPGDGIGPEVVAAGVQVLEAYRAVGLDLELWPLDLGAERYLRDRTTLPPETLEEIRTSCGAILLGALGDPRVPGQVHAREILLRMRFELDLYANVRPCRALHDRLVPLRDGYAKDVQLVIFRENTEGAYVGVGGSVRRGTPDEIAVNEEVHTRRGVERIIRAAFAYAEDHGLRRICMADKGNAMLAVGDLWRRVWDEVAAEFPYFETEHLYADALCLHLVRDPGRFDVIVTGNLFGDLLTDLAAALQGGLGMAASANLHVAGPPRVGLFEPVHGSAPDLVGRDQANPFAAVLCVGMLLEHLGVPAEQRRLERLVRDAIDTGACTPDVGGRLGTRAASQALTAALIQDLERTPPGEAGTVRSEPRALAATGRGSA